MKYRVIHDPSYQVLTYQVQVWTHIKPDYDYWRLLDGFDTEEKARACLAKILAAPIGGKMTVIAEFDTEAA